MVCLRKDQDVFFKQKKSLLIMDTARSHIGDEIGSTFQNLETDAKYVDGGMTPLLQFLDTHVNKSFKDRLKDTWADWMDCGEVEYTRTGKSRRASYEMVAKWAQAAWKEVPNDMIVSGFKQCGYIEWDGNLDVLHSRLKETITNRAVPMSLILEVEEMILAIEEELLEQPAIDVEQSNNGEDEEQQDYESEVDSDECLEDTDIEIEID